MFRNYFITAFRNLRRNKLFSLINILGLSIGISASLLIFLIVYFELSYDRFEPDRNRIYRVVLDAQVDGEAGHSASVPAPLGYAIEKELTGIEETVQIFSFDRDGQAAVSLKNNKGSEQIEFKHQKDIIFTKPSYFHLFPYKWLTGSAETSLKNAFTVVLTKSRAHQYFPSIQLNDIIGKELTYNDEFRITVSGIVDDLNKTSSFGAKEFISFPTINNTSLRDRLMMDVWNDWMAYSQLLVKLSKGKYPYEVETQLKELFKKYNKDKKSSGLNTTSFVLQPLANVHFNEAYQGFGKRLANTKKLYSLLAVAAFLLILACINFINLSTAQASRRAKEIGIRKTMGGSKGQLMTQFLSETIFITTMSTIASVLLTPFLLKAFRQFIPQELELNLLSQSYIILFLFLLTLLVSFLAGMYPAMVLSGFNPVNTLKNQAYGNTGIARSAWVRKTLTVSQFVVAQFFIIGTILVGKQINFSLNKNLGFRKDAIINFETPYNKDASHGANLLNELKSIPEIELVSTGFLSPASKGAAFTNIKYAGKEDLKNQVQLRWGDSNYIKVYQINLLAGRNVQKTDSFQEFLINEIYSRELGFQHPQEAIGKLLNFNGKDLPIVGVMKDFYMQSTHSPIGPVAFAGGSGSIFHVLLKPKGDDGKVWQTAIVKMQKAFNRIYPKEDFNYAFVDDNLARLYEDDQNTSQLLLWATGLTIVISCLGLLGMVIYVVHIRTKEIGVRKVLGAPISHIVFILSKDFIGLVLLALFIAAPIAWWASYKWLEGFVYRTNISWWIFFVSAVLMLLFALITLGFQTLRAALVNPVKSLRTE